MSTTLNKTSQAINQVSLSVFCSENFPGCSTHVVLLDHWPSADKQWTQLLEQHQSTLDLQPHETLVFTTTTPIENNNRFHVRWYQAGREVSFCGSGTLAAGKALLDHLNSNNPIELVSKNHFFTVQTHPKGFSFQVKAPDFQLTDIPTGISNYLNIQPVKAAKVGDENGYWIFEFADVNTLLALCLNIKKLCHNTQRAIIATAATPNQPFDYALRYFAPQYGVDEDTVTGSANAIVANYWQYQLAKTTFRVVQYHVGKNPSTARTANKLYVEINGDLATIAGSVSNS